MSGVDAHEIPTQLPQGTSISARQPRMMDNLIFVRSGGVCEKKRSPPFIAAVAETCYCGGRKLRDKYSRPKIVLRDLRYRLCQELILSSQRAILPLKIWPLPALKESSRQRRAFLCFYFRASDQTLSSQSRIRNTRLL